MIKLFVSDIDGTLLNDKHIVSDKTKQAIRDLIASGVTFMTASGRHFESSLKPVEDMNLDIDFIVLNGGDCRNMKGESVRCYPLEERQVDAIYEILKTDDSTVEYYCRDYAYTQIPFDEIDEVYLKDFVYLIDGTIESSQAFLDSYDVKSVMRYEADFEEIRKHQIVKIEIHFRDIKNKERMIERLKPIQDIHVTQSHAMNIEITHGFASKGNMVEEMMQRYGFHHNEVLVIGDSDNDVSMLSRFFYSYAMGNASEDVKEVANFEAPSNANDGVAQIMYQVIEDNKKKA